MECRENSTLVTLEESEKQVVIRCYHLGTLSMGGEEGSDEDDDNIQAGRCLGRSSSSFIRYGGIPGRGTGLSLNSLVYTCPFK